MVINRRCKADIEAQRSSVLLPESQSLMTGNVSALDVLVCGSEISESLFNVEIPVSGRYRIEVSAQGDAVLSISDHIHNVDGRNYDITSAMSVCSPDAYYIVSKDGAPLSEGLHSMKILTKAGAAKIEWIRFTLMQAHKCSPFTLTQNLDGGEWELVWSDEFDVDGAPNPEVWAYDIGDWGWGNNEAQYYTAARLENARCENGRLIIEARRDRPDGGWSSARLTTRGRMSLLYGRIECRARMTAGTGNWPAVWLLGDAYRDELSWPYCGEIGLVESIGRELDDETGDGPVHFACHTGAYYFKNDNHITRRRQVPQLGGTFHAYALEWTPEALHIFFDGEHVYTYDKTANELEFPFNTPQNLVVNMAMGGGKGGSIDPSLTAERVELEYVRVYGRKK
jgi:beta-glucanase (GH16 family)